MKKAHSILFQGRLEFAAPRNASYFSKAHPFEHVLFRVLVIAVVVLVGFYTYFIVSSALAVISQKTMNDQAVKLESSVGALEANYLAMTKDINENLGNALGLVSVSDTTYVRRPVGTAIAPTTHDAI